MYKQKCRPPFNNYSNERISAKRNTQIYNYENYLLHFGGQKMHCHDLQGQEQEAFSRDPRKRQGDL